jgi:hypothetical protein
LLRRTMRKMKATGGAAMAGTKKMSIFK